MLCHKGAEVAQVAPMFIVAPHAWEVAGMAFIAPHAWGEHVLHKPAASCRSLMHANVLEGCHEVAQGALSIRHVPYALISCDQGLHGSVACIG